MSKKLKDKVTFVIAILDVDITKLPLFFQIFTFGYVPFLTFPADF